MQNSDPTTKQAAVRARYANAARRREESLCCPVTYDPRFLAAIPEEILERDYGCGEPSAHLRRGESVLDLGCGAGKVCFIAAQVVGAEGRVTGIDMNEAMLALARGAAPVVAERLGYANVRFLQGRIQDLRLDLDAAAGYLREHAIDGPADVVAFQEFVERQRALRPLVESASVDVVISNCVLNLVPPSEKPALFLEIHRVLRPGGRAVISDIVADRDVPEALQADPELWSGCISGALREDRFVGAFSDAGLYGTRILSRAGRPWRTVAGIEFRSITVEAFKGEEGPCLDAGHAVVYKGPFREVLDDDGHRLRRGVPERVCEKTFRLLQRPPYGAAFEFLEPRSAAPAEGGDGDPARPDAAGPPQEPCTGSGARRSDVGGRCC